VLYLDLCLKKKRSPEWDSMLPMSTAFLKGKSLYYVDYVGRSLKGGFWRYWNTLKAARAQMGASGYAQQTVVGIMQALVDKEVVEHKSVVLWRAKKTEEVTPFNQASGLRCSLVPWFSHQIATGRSGQIGGGGKRGVLM
jgi:hypothetical protein